MPIPTPSDSPALPPALEIFATVARRPLFCCGCICLSREDRRRARRVFRLVRRITDAWEDERRTFWQRTRRQFRLAARKGAALFGRRT